MVEQAIQDGARDHRVTSKDLRPRLEAPVGRDDEAPLL
jgi:hypothetical protein